MSSRAHNRAMIIAVVLGLLMAYSAQCGPAHAEPMMLPTGTTIAVKGKPPVTIKATHYLFTRPMLDRANAAAKTSRRLTRQLVDCSRRVVRVTEPEPGWRIGMRWFAIGLAVSGAFVTGAML